MVTFAGIWNPKTRLPNGVLKSGDARAMILRGAAPNDMNVKGALKLSDERKLTHLPDGLTVQDLDLSGCTNLRALPERLHALRLNLTGCTALTELPRGLRCHELIMSGTRLAGLPDDLHVDFRLDCSNCKQLSSLPVGLKLGSLILRDCVALESLPEGLEVCFLDISGCVQLHRWPQEASLQFGRLTARGCRQLTALPAWINNLSQLDLSGCSNLFHLQEGLQVGSWLDIAGTGLTDLPASLAKAQIRWRGVPIDRRIAFNPQTITAREVLSAENVELRRVLLDRMGYAAFFQQTNASVMDRDRDAGGERMLLKIAIPGDEDLVCLSVSCPSTGRQYVLRVPPNTRTCRKGAAWLAGFDREADYKPLVET